MHISYFTQPPTPTNSETERKGIQPLSLQELKARRQPPSYTFSQICCQMIFFIIIGIPRTVICVLYSLIAGALWIISCTIWRSLGSPLYGRHILQLFWSALARILLFILGIIKINYYGHPDSYARFLISNHPCFFDGWLFLPLLPRPLDKKELLKIPCIKDMFEIFDGITIDRTKSSGMTKILIENASNTNSPMIQMFPEGASTNGTYMLRFHLGAFLSDLPIQPAAIRYKIWGTSPKWSHISYFHNYPSQWFAFLSIPFITVDINFLQVVSMKNSQESDPRQYADEVSLEIANFLGIPVVELTSSAIYKQNKKKKFS